MSLKLATLNTRSINNTEKIYYIKDLIIRHQIDILALQETHFVNEDILKDIKPILNNFYVCIPIQENSSKGVGFIISNSIHVISIETPSIERISILSLQIAKTKIDLVNIYSPNSCNEQIDFINSLYDCLTLRKNLIFLCDLIISKIIQKKERLVI